MAQLFDNGGQLVTQESRGKLITEARGNTMIVHTQVTLQKTAKPLTLLLCVFKPQLETEWSLRFFSTQPVDVQPMASPASSAVVSAAAKPRRR